MKTKTADVLSHEKLHFDISEVYARMLRKKITETKDWGGNPHNTMEKIFSEINNESNVLQNSYDKDTAHGTIPLKQSQCKTKIELMLAEYSAWKN
mgnify:CR=1 FL=1